MSRKPRVKKKIVKKKRKLGVSGVSGRKLGQKSSLSNPKRRNLTGSRIPSSSDRLKNRYRLDPMSRNDNMNTRSTRTHLNQTKNKPKGWLSLETDYKKLNYQLKLLGVVGDFDFCDLLGFDEQLCALIPKPVLAVVLVHPMNKDLKDEKNQEDENPQIYRFDPGGIFTSDIFFLRQKVANSCGTIALLHSILNQISPKEPPKVKLGINEDGPLFQYFLKTRHLSPEGKGEALKDPEFKGIKEAHQKTARLGIQQKRNRGRGRKRRRKRKREFVVPKHFTCFVFHELSGMIIELDGTRKWPIQRGQSSRETFLVDICRVIMQLYISKCPLNPYDFAAIVLKKKM